MKKYFASFLALVAAAACAPKFDLEEEEKEVDNPSIEVSLTSVNAEYTSQVYDIDVDANTRWVITRTDDEGQPIDWVKFNTLSSKGACSIQMKVTENPNQEERKAVITFECGKNAEAKAFIDITQAANPNEPVKPDEPDEPDDPQGPEGDVFKVTFDFTGYPQDGWPVKEGDVAPNGGRDAIYYIDNYPYIFKLATCNVDAGSTKCPFWTAPSADMPGYLNMYAQYRYAGIPVLAGYRVYRIEVAGGGKMLQNVAPKFFITDRIAENTTVAAAVSNDSEEVVAGGEFQELAPEGTGSLDFTLTGSEVGKQYYLYARVKGTVGSITVTYLKEGVNPPGEGGDAPEPPQPLEDIVLDIDFTTTPEGWPTVAAASWSTLKDCDSGLAVDNGGTAVDNTHIRAKVTYTQDDKSYDFMLADPDGAASHNVYISAGKGVYLGTYRYFGLPAVDGYRLAQVVTVQNASTKDEGWRPVGISSTIGYLELEPGTTKVKSAGGYNYIAGGETQNQDANLGEYTYNLTETEAGTMYYLYSQKNASIFKSIKLTYTPVQ